MSHRCPNWCHKCPSLIEIAREHGRDITDPIETTMPWCYGGIMHGLAGCHCDRRCARVKAAEDRVKAIRQLRTLIKNYPEDARRLLAEQDGLKPFRKVPLRSVDAS